MRTPSSTSLVTPSDIAEMAGVSRAAVSNWRKRATDFPAPAGGTSVKPLFDRAAVTSWLEGRQYVVSNDRGHIEVFGIFNAFRGLMQIESMVSLLLAMLCAKKLSAASSADTERWDGLRKSAAAGDEKAFESAVLNCVRSGELWAELVDVPALQPNSATFRNLGRDKGEFIHRLVRVVDEIPLTDLPTVGDRALSRATASQGRSGGEIGLVGSRTSQILANAAASSSTEGVVYDPACGVGEAAITLWSARTGDMSVVGHEVNREIAQIARQRFFLHDIPATIETADVLASDPSPSLAADTIVLEPPFGMSWKSQQNLADARWEYGTAPASTSDLAWIQHAVAHLASNGRAYVITSMGPLFTSGPSARIRSGLVRDGCVEAVVALPPKLLPHTSIPVALWVLRRPQELANRETVLLVDGSEASDPEGQIATWLELGDRDSTEGDPQSTTVPIVELLAEDTNMNPGKWIAPTGADPAEAIARYSDAQRDLESSLSSIIAASPISVLDDVISVPRILTIKDLLRQEAGLLIQGRHRPHSEDGQPDPLLITGKNLGTRIPSVPEGAVPPTSDDVTQPGDILVALLHGIRCQVDYEGGHLLGSGVYRLRITTEDLDPEYVAHCIRGRWNTRFFIGTTIQRANLRDFEIPVVPVAEQRTILAALTHAEELAERATALATAAQTATGALLDVVRFAAPSAINTTNTS